MSTQELENAVIAPATNPKEEQAIDATPPQKEEVGNAAPQHKEEVYAFDDDNSPEICLSHLPATEKWGGGRRPLCGSLLTNHLLMRPLPQFYINTAMLSRSNLNNVTL